MRVSASILIVSMMAVLLFGGCEFMPAVGSDDGLRAGTFKVEVQGEVNRTFQGEAVFETLHGLGNIPIFFLMLRDVEEPGEDYRLVRFVHGDHQRPEAGTYTLADLEQGNDANRDAITAGFQADDIDGSFKSTGGMLDIRVASDEALVGSFEFPAYEWVSEGHGQYRRATVTVSGEFHAVRGDVGIILN